MNRAIVYSSFGVQREYAPCSSLSIRGNERSVPPILSPLTWWRPHKPSLLPVAEITAQVAKNYCSWEQNGRECKLFMCFQGMSSVQSVNHSAGLYQKK